MTRSEYLLTCLAEECAEVAQRVSKALRFGLSEVQPGQPMSNADRILGELDDLLAVTTILQLEGVLPEAGPPSDAVVDAKRAKIERFMAISREQGTLAA